MGVVDVLPYGLCVFGWWFEPCGRCRGCVLVAAATAARRLIKMMTRRPVGPQAAKRQRGGAALALLL
ncbi:MAG: hypothetical protein DRH24_12020 [Deltaproteobacteria bacterium]|nr:MAG: hypothetical protein DRH24_12020 [Deltaproteobacteria bacterium]